MGDFGHHRISGVIRILSLTALLLCSPFLLSQAAVTTSIAPSALPPCPAPCTNQPTAVAQSGSTYNITGGARPGNGPNLFHSFGTFSVGTPDTANFVNNQNMTTANIISRVTGNQVSNIYGTIQTTGFGSAALWLINPAGVVFGPNAQLNVGGAVHISTADYLRMTDGAIFYADMGKTSMLTSAPVTAFGFLSSNPAAITVKGSTLTVPAGQTLSLVGGNGTFPDPDNPAVNVPPGVTMTGGALSAPGGQINIASVASAGEVQLNPGSPTGPTLTGFGTLGTITLSGNAKLSTSGTTSGPIFIQGGTLVMNQTSAIEANGGNATASGINVNVQNMIMNDSSSITSGDGSNVSNGNISLNVNTFQAEGTSPTTPVIIKSSGFGGGAITIAGNGQDNAQQIVLNNSKILTTGQVNVGGVPLDSGHIKLQANDITIQNSSLATSAPVNSPGSISLIARNSIKSMNSSFSSFTGQGAPGTISFSAGTEIDLLSNTSVTQGIAQGGDSSNVILTSPTLNISSSKINTAGGVDDGPSGNINIQANVMNMTDSVVASQKTVMGPATAFLFGQVGTINITGYGGINTSAASLTLSNSAISTEGRFGVSGGPITINAGQVSLQKNSTISASVDAGKGGDITLRASNLSLDNSSILSESHGRTDTITFVFAPLGAGTVMLNVDAVTLKANSQISAQSTNLTAGNSGGAGAIVIRGSSADTAQSITLGGNSAVTTSIQSGSSSTPTSLIDLRAQTINIADGSSISSTTAGGANAGQITASIGTLTMTNGASISSNSTSSPDPAAGNAGTITIQGLTGSGSPATSVSLDNSIISTTISGGQSVATGGLPANIPATIGITANNITLTNGAKITADTSGAAPAGDITLNANQVSLTNASVSTSTTGAGQGGSIIVQGLLGNNADLVAINDSQLNATTGGIGNGGSITVGANTLSLSSQNVQTSINASTFPNSAGNGGAIQLTANNMSLDGNSLIIAKTQGSGNAGDITIAATNISLNGRGSTALIAADTLGPGKAGLIDIGVNQLTLGPGSQISTSSGADIDGQGRGAAGTIEIHGLQGKNLAADSVTLSSGGIFSSTQGQGVGGDVSILANMVMLDGKSTISADTASPFSSAVGGDITITANTLLSMKGGSTITAGSLETQTVTPKANAGSITITAPTFTMDGAGTNISATTEGTGIAGNITANVGTLAMTNGASISSSSTLTAPTAGNAGNITLVSTQDLFLTDSTVQTSAAQATGGNITLTAPGIVLLDNSKLTSSVNGPVGSNGGNITIDPQFVILRNNSQILAQANAGQGGNITIVATGAVLEEPGSVIDASSALGINGEVDIHAPIQQLSGTIVPLPQAYGNIATLYGQHCAAQKGGQFSSFVQRGRDGVPPQPRDYIPSPLMFELSETPPPTGTLPPPSLPAVRLGMSELGQPSPTSFTILSGCRS